jgi:excisionase family DNA binding protein
MKATLTVSDVAATLQMSKTSIYKLAESGKLPSIKIGSSLRFTENQISRFLSNCSKSTKKALLSNAD